MIGLMFLGFWALFFLGSYLLAYVVFYQCDRFGVTNAPWWGVLTFVLIMAVMAIDYPIVKWKLQKLCKAEAGFKQYKTIEQWQQENPGVWETIGAVEGSKYGSEILGNYHSSDPLNLGSNHRYDYLNQRFIIIRKDKHLVSYLIRKYTSAIQDIKTGEIMASNTKFYMGYKNGDIREWIFFWFSSNSGCFSSLPHNKSHPDSQFKTFKLSFEKGKPRE